MKRKHGQIAARFCLTPLRTSLPGVPHISFRATATPTVSRPTVVCVDSSAPPCRYQVSGASAGQGGTCWDPGQ